MPLKAHFSRFLSAQDKRLHFAAHSLHPWPDISFEAQQQAWLDAAALMDRKWAHILGELMPTTQAHVARLLNLPDPSTLCFAPNTHELVMRLISSIEARPFRVLTTDGEFLSFDRQIRRLEEAGQCVVERVPLEPFHSFAHRFKTHIEQDGHHLIYLSQVFYSSGFRVEDLGALVAAVPSRRSLVVIDGYHAFMAMPVDLARIHSRAFYLAGGQKYAMSGEGIAFMHCPPGYAERPLDTGWFAEFSQLNQPDRQGVPYPRDAGRFASASFDATALYRFNAVMEWMRQQQITPAMIRAHVANLSRELLGALDQLNHPVLHRRQLLPTATTPRGNFLSFRHPAAPTLHAQLAGVGVTCDLRGPFLRLGLGLYHDRRDISELILRLTELPPL